MNFSPSLASSTFTSSFSKRHLTKHHLPKMTETVYLRSTLISLVPSANMEQADLGLIQLPVSRVTSVAVLRFPYSSGGCR